ncbi:MAG: phage holin family protein [Flavobacteriaceae bacterium]|jgi:hypothetical protein|nr:phage holin family protein [Flavobacteriaceae bacterium]
MIDLLKNYLDKRIKLLKYDLVAVVANIGSNLVSAVLILVFVLFILLMLNLALGFYIGQLMDDVALGFLLVGGFYIFIFILFLTLGKKKIDKKIKDVIVSSAMTSIKDNKD